MSGFTVSTEWLKTEGPVRDPLAATFARLGIAIDKTVVTAHTRGRSDKDQGLAIPVYYLAEWIAENWWVVLNEPNKDESRPDDSFYLRHAIIAAQHGFPLPDVSIVPFGRSFRINCNPREAPYANTRFSASAFADVSRDTVERTLATFLDDTVGELECHGIKDTALAVAWRGIKSLTPEQKTFCELIGALGILPADASESLAAAIETIYEKWGHQGAKDICLAATADTVETSLQGIDAVDVCLQHSATVDISVLSEVGLPADNDHAPSWRRGAQAAKRVRDKLGVDAGDDQGPDKIFNRLNINAAEGARLNPPLSLPFVGAVDRQENAVKFALLQPEVQHRRFSAGRAAYIAWATAVGAKRLVTNAVTRDQQASRSFSAEILIPQAYLKSLAGQTRTLRHDQIHEAARRRRVMPDVAFKQAYNAGIRVEAI